MSSSNRHLASLAVAATATAAIFGIAACGDSGGSDSAAAGAIAAQSTLAAPTGSDENQVKATLAEIQQAYIDEDGKTVCELLSADVREQAMTLPGSPRSCPAAMAKMADQTQKAGVKQRAAKVASVKVDGDTAMAMVRDGRRPPIPVKFLKEDGRWRLSILLFSAAPSTAPSGL